MHHINNFWCFLDRTLYLRLVEFRGQSGPPATTETNSSFYSVDKICQDQTAMSLLLHRSVRK